MDVGSHFIKGLGSSHHPLVILPIDGDRLLLDDGVGDLMEVTEHLPALVLLLLWAALLLSVHFVLLGPAFFFGDHARLQGRRGQKRLFGPKRCFYTVTEMHYV